MAFGIYVPMLLVRRSAKRKFSPIVCQFHSFFDWLRNIRIGPPPGLFMLAKALLLFSCRVRHNAPWYWYVGHCHGNSTWGTVKHYYAGTACLSPWIIIANLMSTMSGKVFAFSDFGGMIYGKHTSVFFITSNCFNAIVLVHMAWKLIMAYWHHLPLNAREIFLQYMRRIFNT